MTAEFDRVSPQNLDAERAVIGAMILNESVIPEALKVLPMESAGLFYAPAHQYIYDAIVTLYDNREAIDPLSIKDVLEARNHLEGAGGLAYIAEVTGLVPTSANIVHYCRLVRKKYIQRRIISMCANTRSEAYTIPDGLNALTDALQAELGTLLQLPSDTLQHVSKITPDFTDLMVKISDGEIEPGLKTGMDGLDELTGGLRSGDSFIIAAKPSVGKTAMALNIATNIISAKPNAKIVMYSMEMTNNQLLSRMCQSLTGVNFRYMERQYEVETNRELMKKAVQVIDESCLFIDDTPHPTIEDVVRKLRAFQVQHGNPDILIIDYLQLMTSSRKFSNRQEEVSMISRTIKGLAREMRCPVVVLSQFSRESGDGRKPTISQLRESGAIEQDADAILILHPDDNNTAVLHAHLDKNRGGPTGMFSMRFTKKYQLLESITPDEVEQCWIREKLPEIMKDFIEPEQTECEDFENIWGGE